MHDSITIKHNIPYLSVTEEPKFYINSSQTKISVTKGVCTFPLDRECPKCGHSLHVHGCNTIKLQDIELLGSINIIELTVSRLKCKCCNYSKMQDIPFKAENHKLTTRLEAEVLSMLDNWATLSSTSKAFNIHPAIVKDIDKKRLDRLTWMHKPKPCEYILIDEFLLHKGHHYATIVINGKTGHILYLEKGKKKQQAINFINAMGPEWMSHVKAVGMDMNAQFDSAFKEAAPHIKVVYDKFHMIKMYNDNVLTAIRRRLQNEADEKGDKSLYELLKGSRYLLLTSKEKVVNGEEKARENNKRLNSMYTNKEKPLPPGERIMRIGQEKKLNDLLAANQELNIAYLLLDQFKYSYSLTDMKTMYSGFKYWFLLAFQSKVPEIINFAKTIKRRFRGIKSSIAHKITSGRVEGINNMIKTIRRSSYGFRDIDYFFNKIMFFSYKQKAYYKSCKVNFMLDY